MMPYWRECSEVWGPDVAAWRKWAVLMVSKESETPMPGWQMADKRESRIGMKPWRGGDGTRRRRLRWGRLGLGGRWQHSGSRG